MNINEHIAKRILALRKEKSFTAEKLAWTADLSKSCVSYAEKGIKDNKFQQSMQSAMLLILLWLNFSKYLITK